MHKGNLNIIEKEQTVGAAPKSTVYFIDMKRNFDSVGIRLPERWILIGTYYFEQEMLIQFHRLADTQQCKSGAYTYRAKYPDGRILITEEPRNDS